MCSSQRNVLASLAAALILTGNTLSAAEPSWKNKPAAGWTEEEAFQILLSSPWVKSLTPGVLHQQSEFERRDGGNMGMPRGLGYDGIGDEESAFSSRRVGEVPTLLLRWETALPVRAARKKAHMAEPPKLNADAYSLAVYGVPGRLIKGDPLKLGKPLKGQAVLRRRGKKDVKPTRVEVFPSADGPIIVYQFPRTLEITRDDKRLDFVAVVGRLSFMQVFYTEDMQFEGILEF
jgi:hypothetical protein